LSDGSFVRAATPGGFVAGLLSGLLGIGGGLMVSPVLIGAGMPIKRATGTALAVVLPTACVAVAFQLMLAPQALAWWVAATLAVGAQLGVWGASRALERTPELLLRWLFLGLLLYSAARNLGLLGGAPASGSGVPSQLTAVQAGLALMTGVLAGTSSVFFGVGGGVVMVPGLLLLVGEFGVREAMATSLLAMVPTAAASLRGAIRAQRVEVQVARAWMLPAALGAGVGVALRQNGLEAAHLAQVFGLFLLFVAWRIRPNVGAQGPRSPRRS